MGYRQSSRGLNAGTSDRAAIFVDYDNLYHTLRDLSSRGGSAADYTFEIFNEVRRYLEEGDDTPTILATAYADFVNLADGGGLHVQDRLYSEGIDPVLTPSEPQVNASELSLCIDATSLLAERGDIGTIVIITGDRSFVPLVRSIRNSGRRALVAAVTPPPAGSTPSLGEDDAYLDARNLLSQSSRDDLTVSDRRDRSASRSRSGGSRRSASSRQEQTTGAAAKRRYRSIDNPMARRTVEVTEEHFGQYEEVYLTPLLRKLSDVLGEQHDPKSLVSELEAAGAVRLEKRDGYPYDYTVLILNQDHPDVQEIQDDFYSQQSTGYNGASDSYNDYDSYDEYDEDYEGGAYEEEAEAEDAYDEDAHDETSDADDVGATDDVYDEETYDEEPS